MTVTYITIDPPRS